MARCFQISSVLIASSLVCGFSAFADEPGVSATEVLIGASQSLTGEGAPVRPTTEAVYGVEAYLRKVNSEGGINGRKLKYITLDNQYLRPLALETTKKLVEQEHVFALLSPFGSPTMVAIKPYVVKNGIPTIAPIDGDSRPRVPTSPATFFVRDTFEHEARRSLNLIQSVYGTDELAIYHPKSTVGETITQQYQKAAHDEHMKILAIADDSATPGDFTKAIAVLRDSHAKVIVLAGNAIANAKFLKAALDAGLKAKWLVNSPSFAPEFYNSARTVESVVMSQVFPMDSSAYPFVKEFEAQMKKENHSSDPYVLEGYLNAAVFCEGLKRAGHDLTRKGFIDAMNSMHDVSLGGIKISYSADDHLGLKEIYFYQVTKDGYAPLPRPRD